MLKPTVLPRERKTVVNVNFETLKDEYQFGPGFGKKYRNSLFRLEGEVSSLGEASDQNCEQSCFAVVVNTAPDTTAYLAIFPKDESPGLAGVEDGYRITFLCDRLASFGRVEGCTLESKRAPDANPG
jgi:hypothetical protein